jgi:hypothetical protein
MSLTTGTLHSAERVPDPFSPFDRKRTDFSLKSRPNQREAVFSYYESEQNFWLVAYGNASLDSFLKAYHAIREQFGPLETIEILGGSKIATPSINLKPFHKIVTNLEINITPESLWQQVSTELIESTCFVRIITDKFTLSKEGKSCTLTATSASAAAIPPFINNILEAPYRREYLAAIIKNMNEPVLQ